ncbi:MAG: 2,6-dihydropseudooxynicotine hydrolase [Candidatus Anoxychlamydiales bacterium]|nr:2,6-dihydropseudooxynicotine hydrolase [Candidatus Anoxychlamydiales bacterium]
MKKIITTLIILAAIFAGIYMSFHLYRKDKTPTVKTAKAKTTEVNWYDDLIFKNKSFSFEFFRALNYAYSEGADIAECISTGRQIKDGDINSWYTNWDKIATRLYNLGSTWEKQNQLVSTTEAYLRASNYYRTAGFFFRSKNNLDKGIAAADKSVNSFLNATEYMPSIEPIKIPYENTYLPGYFIKTNRKTKAPLLIVTTGFDGTAEELYFEVGYAALKRGYNCIIFDGPGQGQVISKQKIPFRYDWEKVVSPVIDYGEKQRYVDTNKIAIMGISYGGYFAPRAAAFDDRIKACIANGGILDFYDFIKPEFPPNFLNLAETNPNKFNSIMLEQMKQSPETKWFFDNGMWTFGTTTPSDLILKLKKYSLKDVVQNITCSMLVIKSEKDHFNLDQPKKLYDALKTNNKTFLEFTTEQAADAHCQMGAIAFSNEKIFNWLDKTLDFK